jgi:anti-sigma B factor antagonist/stage II sporulation protein AA (anti-sigma F factor antagonist)
MNTEGPESPGDDTVPLTVTVVPLGNVTVVRLSGELDLATEDVLTAVADRVLATPARTVRLDLTELTFCDVRGLAAILRLRARVVADERRLVLAGVSPALRRLLQVTGVGRHLDIE